MTGLRNNECVTPTDASDCGGGVPIYDARMGGNVCVATAQQCEADKVLVNSNTCTPKAMACMGTEGYLSSSRSCGVPTAVADCAGLTNQIFNAGTTNACVADATGCDTNEAAINNACVDRNDCASLMNMRRGYNAATQVCVAGSGASCFALNGGFFLAGTGCVLTASDCGANNAAVRGSSMAICQSRSTACTGR